MPILIERPTIVAAAGSKPKRIEEYVGRASSGEEKLSVARMVSPGEWREPGQRPEFREITVVLRGGGGRDLRCAADGYDDPANELLEANVIYAVATRGE
jgi:hypothetical protein